MAEISIVIPVYNEEGNIAGLHGEIKSACEKNGYTYEIIIVDDGSTDNTGEAARNLHPVKYIRFRKNYGQTAAMDAGIKAAKYGYIVTMDGDGQNDPNDIPALLEHLEKNGFDAVSGWRKTRKDDAVKRLISKGANYLRGILINDGINDSGCSLKIYKKECFENLTLYGEMHRFIPATLRIRGFTIGEIVVNHRPRTAGESKYNFKRVLKGFVDIISVWFWNKFAVRPLHLLGGIGIFSFLWGILFSIVNVYLFFIGSDLSSTVWPLLAVFCLLTGIQLFIFGLIADMLSKNYYDSTKNKSYNIKEIIENQR